MNKAADRPTRLPPTISTGTSSLAPRSIGNLSHVPPCGASEAREPAEIQRSAAPHGACSAAAAAGAAYTTLVALIPGQKRQVLQDCARPPATARQHLPDALGTTEIQTATPVQESRQRASDRRPAQESAGRREQDGHRVWRSFQLDWGASRYSKQRGLSK